MADVDQVGGVLDLEGAERLEHPDRITKIVLVIPSPQMSDKLSSEFPPSRRRCGRTHGVRH